MGKFIYPLVHIKPPIRYNLYYGNKERLLL